MNAASRRHCRQFLQGEDTDLQMLAHLGPVKGACHAGQLQFAVQGLVGHAEQRPVGDAEAEPVGGDGRRFHVERDGPGLRESFDRPALVAQFQLRLSIVATVPVRMICLRS